MAAGIIAFSTANFSAQAQISSVSVTVNANATAPTGITSSLTNAFCNGGETILTATGGAIGTNGAYEWYTEDPSSGTATAIAGASTETYTVIPPVGTTTYYVRTTGECGPSAVAQLSVTVYPTPDVSTSLADAQYCYGASVAEILLEGAVAGSTFDISGGAAIGLADATNVTSVPAFTATNATSAPLTATITVTPNANGCAGTPVTYQIMVMPQVEMVAVADQTICSGEATTLTFAATPLTGVTTETTWTQTNFASQAIGNASETGTADLMFTGLNQGVVDITGNFSVSTAITAQGLTCTSDAETFAITVRPQPNGVLAIASEICEGQPMQLTFNATAGTGDFILHIGQDGATPNVIYNNVVSGTAFDITPAPAVGTHTYDLWYIEDSFGCINQQ